MVLPNAEFAFIDRLKLVAYALDFENARGRHKARVFRAALGVTAENAEILSIKLLEAIRTAECVVGEQDLYGQRYRVDCKIEVEGREATVRSGWIVRSGESVPRLTTCFVLKEQRRNYE